MREEGPTQGPAGWRDPRSSPEEEEELVHCGCVVGPASSRDPRSSPEEEEEELDAFLRGCVVGWRQRKSRPGF